jgi:DNA-binding LacI/PurR family transcriptional regulator
MAGGAKAASYLIQQGHRSLALVLSNPLSSSAMRDRMDGFLLMAQMHSVPVTVLDCKVQAGESSVEKTHGYVYRWLAEHDVDFTAMQVMEDETALAVMHALQEHHMKVPDDMSVMGYGGFRRSAFFNPPLTSIQTDTYTESVETFNALATLLQDRSQVFKKLVMPNVIERLSVRSLL